MLQSLFQIMTKTKQINDNVMKIVKKKKKKEKKKQKKKKQKETGH